ncbi:MAG: NifB/NifX family molybdenum-iron cluster-binding protein [Candidatus Undinarchaeales archaeon]|nr:NifB/NifX family molybdenum-iron cluster-binding protein [Candidatus Undinarchaeales archaeon]MDP7491629.1 NifB/NifX family molybdenum-iron cluster-binding protein [Candidatus Undinarchaeales archaeon]
MKICITSYGRHMEDIVDPCFGDNSIFLIVDTETGTMEAVDNASCSATQGDGFELAQRMLELGVKAVITGNVSPEDFRALKAAGILVYTGASGRARDALVRFEMGDLTRLGSPGGGVSRELT